MEEDPLKGLMREAGVLLARRSLSRGELRDRLAKFGENQQIEQVLDRLESLNLLNDAEYAYNAAVRWMKQDGWGSEQIRQRLASRQIEPRTAESVIARVREEIGDRAALEFLLNRRCRNRRLPEEPRGIRKLIASLLRRGFPEDEIRRILQERMDSAAWHQFETGE